MIDISSIRENPVRLTFYNVTIPKSKIAMNGRKCEICTIVSFQNEILLVDVPNSNSSYSIVILEEYEKFPVYKTNIENSSCIPN